ncbi:MAG: site-specific integrase [Mesorhizobium sp.]|nr:MAG: site-specific integrase [Mesorhizobium sp.]RWE52714.1 MAG: site-specific integrase [Mesorhizobium sp.]TIY06989.1 MAG: site-specific integrase [Mesorhizobium sp.]
MHNPTYVLVSRTGILYFRWPVPKRLHPEGKASTIKVSLRTRDPKDAIRLARLLSYTAHHVSEYGVQSGMQYQELRSVLQQHFKRMLTNQRRKIDQSGPLSATDKAIFEGSQSIAEHAVLGKGDLNLVEGDEPTLAAFIDRYKLPIQPGMPQYDWLRAELHKAYRDYCRDTLAYSASLDSYDFSEPGEPTGQPGTTAPLIPLRDAVDHFMREGLRSGLWRERSEALRRSQLAMLLRLVGEDTDLASIHKPEARTVSDRLQRLPKNMNKSPAFRDKSLDELLGMEHGSGMGVSTLNDYLNTYSMLFAWAERQGYVQENPFSGLALPTAKTSSRGKRKAFSDDQLQLIERTLLTELAGRTPKPSHKWASLILMYTGARAGEVCQLRGSDIQAHDGVTCLSIDEDEEGKRIKTQASKRLVPIHSRLLELGLLEFIRASGTGRLFPDYTYSPNYGLSKNLSTWFNEQLLPKLGLKAPDIVLHSLRHTMNTKLHHADVPASLVKAITGHTDDSMSTGTYFAAGFKPRQLREAIERFSINK